MKNKKAQIGSTMTWFTATIIIFFIMVLFLTASSLNSGKKKVVSGWDDISFERFNGSLKSQEILSSILRSKVKLGEEEKSLKDWLVFGIENLNEEKKAKLKEAIRIEIRKYFNDVEKGCYVFISTPATKSELEKLSKGVSEDYIMQFSEKDSIVIGGKGNRDFSYQTYSISGSMKSNLFKRMIKLVLLKDTRINSIGIDEGFYQSILVKFYIGGCE